MVLGKHYEGVIQPPKELSTTGLEVSNRKKSGIFFPIIFSPGLVKSADVGPTDTEV